MSYLVKGAPFRFRGVANVEDCHSSAEVMEKAGLAWNVEKCEMYANMPSNVDISTGVEDDTFIENTVNGQRMLRKCQNAYGIYRTDLNIPLGLVKERYEPVQNIDAFKFFDGAIGKNEAIWQTAGAFGYGERIFVSAKLPNNILVNGDPVDNYLVFTNSHDGSSGVKILFTPIRVVCQNTLNAAIRTAQNYVSFRHTQSVHKNIDIAHEILGITQKQIAIVGEAFNAMNKIKVNDDKAVELMANVIFTDAELTRLKETGHTPQQVAQRYYYAINDAELSTQKVNVLCNMLNYYNVGPGQKEIMGTGWGVYGAITGYYSNIDNTEKEKRMDTLLYGDRSRKIQQAGEYILQLA